MATHSSVLAWETPWTEESGWLQSMGSQRVRHNLATKHSSNVHQKMNGQTKGDVSLQWSSTGQ